MVDSINELPVSPETFVPPVREEPLPETEPVRNIEQEPVEEEHSLDVYA